MKKLLSAIILILIPTTSLAQVRSLGGTYVIDGTGKIFTTEAHGYGDIPVENIDKKTFRVINGIYARDKNNILVQWAVIPTLDKKTFKVLSETFAKDKNVVYWTNETLSGADIKTFKPLSFSFGKDKAHVYFEWKILTWADPKTFKVIEDGHGAMTAFSKDKSAVYRNLEKTQYDLKTFVRKGDYNMDKNWIVCESQYTQKLESYDRATFKVLNRSYAKDKNNVYMSCQKVEGANPKTFKIPKN